MSYMISWTWERAGCSICVHMKLKNNSFISKQWKSKHKHERKTDCRITTIYTYYIIFGWCVQRYNQLRNAYNSRNNTHTLRYTTVLCKIRAANGQKTSITVQKTFTQSTCEELWWTPTKWPTIQPEYSVRMSLRLPKWNRNVRRIYILAFQRIRILSFLPAIRFWTLICYSYFYTSYMLYTIYWYIESTLDSDQNCPQPKTSRRQSPRHNLVCRIGDAEKTGQW